MLSLLEPNMMCLVQGFAGPKDAEQFPEKRKKTRRLSILRRKKSPAINASKSDDNLLHPHTASFSSKAEKTSLKEASSSSPSLDFALLTAQQTAAAAAAEALLNATPGSSKARQKKFHRHFKQVDPEERVLDYFSCALVADILLQGHLYITKNYFAFYSNVFGYTTKLLIPTASVLSVTKEKTAYIIPNAVGVATEDEKHVFGSLLSRDSTYRLMVQVWSAAITTIPSSSPSIKREDSVSDDEKKKEEEDSSNSGSESLTESNSCAKTEVPTLVVTDTEVPKLTLQPTYAQLLDYARSMPPTTILLVVSTILIALLFLSASILIYRLSRIQTSYSEAHFDSGSLEEIQTFLSNNIDHLYKVRQSLETLSLLIDSKNELHSQITTQKTQHP